MRVKITLPKPAHELGYTWKEVKRILRSYGVSVEEYKAVAGIDTCALHPGTGEVLRYGCDIYGYLDQILNRAPALFD